MADLSILVQPLPPLRLRELSYNGLGLILTVLCCFSRMLSQNRRKKDCASGNKSWPAGKGNHYPDWPGCHLQTPVTLESERDASFCSLNALFFYQKHFLLEVRKEKYGALLIFTTKKRNPREKFLEDHLLGLIFKRYF